MQNSPLSQALPCLQVSLGKWGTENEFLRFHVNNLSCSVAFSSIFLLLPDIDSAVFD